MKINDAVQHFLMDAEVKSRTKTTLISYRQRLGVMVQVLETVCKVTELEGVTVFHLRQYVQHLLTQSIPTGRTRELENGQTFSVTTVRAYVRVLKSFFSWCYQEDLIDSNPTSRLKLPKPPVRVIPAFTQEHLDKMLSTCDPNTETGFRDYVIMLLLLDTGMRISELCTLHMLDIHDTYVKVYGKGRREREIGIHPEVGKLVWKYIHKHRHPKDANETRLFIGRGVPLNQSGLKSVISRIKHESGLDDIKVSAHVFRHTFSKMYLERGGELFKLSRELGHSSVQITEIYLKDFGSTQARKDHTTFSPISGMQLKKYGKRKKKQEKDDFEDTSH